MELPPDAATVRTTPREAPVANAERTAYLTIALQCEHPSSPPRRFTLNPRRTLIVGRADADAYEHCGAEVLVRVADSRMSRRHARFSEDADGNRLLSDLDSTNGTYVNGERVTRAVLEQGDVIQCGRTVMLFRLSAVGCSDPMVQAEPGEPPGFTTLNPEYGDALARLRGVARSGLPILLIGDSGTGKEVTARGIHALAGRPGPFVGVNCGALASGLAEAQLFGHVRGAFTGATKDEKGFLRAAQFGTLLLDEIAELTPACQVLLLRALQEREVTPVGSVQSHPVDVRIVAATHQALEDVVRQGTFRRDLYARLSGYVHRLPPLRDRLEDFGWLVGEWQRARSRAEGTLQVFRSELAIPFFTHDWPFNVRELFHGLTSASVMAEGQPVGPEHWKLTNHVASVSATSPASGLSPSERRLRASLVGLLEQHGGNLAAVGRSMGKARQQIQRWVRRLGIDVEQYR